jgi:hypothetical protein
MGVAIGRFEILWKDFDISLNLRRVVATDEPLYRKDRIGFVMD